MDKRAEFESLISKFEGQPAVVVEFGPTCHLAAAEGINASERGVEARMVWQGDGPPPPDWDAYFFAAWDLFIFDESYWQAIYTNCRVVFDADCVARTRRGDTAWIEDFF